MEKAVMYGAGNIGRGFIGKLFSDSGFEVVFLDINDRVIDRLNTDGGYTVTVEENDYSKEERVLNVRGVNSGNPAAAVKEIASATIMATAVGVNVLKLIAPVIAEGICQRIKEKRPPMNILICENLMHADRFLKDEIFNYLNSFEKREFDKYVSLVEASIGRMVPALEKTENPLDISVEAFNTLYLDKDAFRAVKPVLKNTVLYSPFSYHIQRKLFVHNMCHAFTAYLGTQYKYIDEAISDPDIRYSVLNAGIESARALALDNKDEKGNPADLGGVLDALEKLIYRFNNKKLKDTVLRVAKDPVRKLKISDRIVGSYHLQKKHGLTPVYTLFAVAAALSFNDSSDLSSLNVKEEVEKNGLKSALLRFTETEFTGEEFGLIEKLFMLLNAKKRDYKEIFKLLDGYRAGKIQD